MSNGVLVPLAGLATAPTVRGAVPTGTDLAAAATGAWALSNVVKGAGPEVPCTKCEWLSNASQHSVRCQHGQAVGRSSWSPSCSTLHC